MKAYRKTLPPQSDSDGICASQMPSSGGAQNLTIAGALASAGSVTLNHGHLISIASDADDSGRTFSITGRDYRGFTISENITGPNATTPTQLTIDIPAQAISPDEIELFSRNVTNISNILVTEGTLILD
jgi:hypothetical protein